MNGLIMNRVFSFFLILSALFVSAQTKNCVDGICMWEDTMFASSEFYQGQTLYMEFWTENQNDIIKEYRIDEPISFELLSSKGPIKLDVRVFGKQNPDKKAVRTIQKNEKIRFLFNPLFLQIFNDYYSEYEKQTKEKNIFPLLKPGKYTLHFEDVVLPHERKVKFHKEMVVKEAKGKLKEELLDYLKSVNYYYKIDYVRDSLVERMYDEHLPTITWFMKKHSESIYSAELFRFIIDGWKQTGYKPALGTEDEIKERFFLTSLYPKLKGNLVGTTQYIERIGKKAMLMKKYGLIQDEHAFVDKFLKGMEDKPIEISDICINNFKFHFPNSKLTNYAREKQKK